MRVEPVEIYSDATNAAVMRHPGRHVPGFLIQGDSLYPFKRRAAIKLSHIMISLADLQHCIDAGDLS